MGGVVRLRWGGGGKGVKGRGSELNVGEVKVGGS